MANLQTNCVEKGAELNVMACMTIAVVAFLIITGSHTRC